MRFLPISIFGFLVFLLPFAMAHFSMAHDPKHPELNSWFKSLHSGKAYCCAEADGIRVENVDWDAKDGHYRVRMDNQWYPVPDNAVLSVPNLDGQTMVWRVFLDGKPNILCFLPGAGG